MSTFTAASASTVTDPHKRVRYSTGLVLGVDEFEQEQAHLLERDRLHARALHGYGTVYGLQVGLEEPPELTVAPGLAVVPSGQHVCVGQRQCAALDDWVGSLEEADFQREGVAYPEFSDEASETTLPVFVVLCYRECETDAVPIPGGPCRSADDNRVPSRVAEDFELQLRLTPPAQGSEEAARVFGAFLRRIRTTEHAAHALSDEEFERAVADELSEVLSQLQSGTPVTGTGDEEPLYLEESSAHVSLRTAFRMWSVLGARGIEFSTAPCGQPAGSDPHCLLLAQIDLTLREGSDGLVLETVSGENIATDSRPVLLETRLLQEYLVHGKLDRETIRRTLATASVEDPTTLRLWFHHGSSVTLTGDAPLTVEVNDTSAAVESISPVETGTNAFDLTLGSPVAPGDRVAVRVQLENVEEQDTGLSLLDRLLAGEVPDYLDRREASVVVYAVSPVSTLRLGELADVDVPESMETEQVLAWNPETGRWQNKVLEETDTLSLEEVAATLPTLPFATADIIDLDSLAAMETENGAAIDEAQGMRDEVAESINGQPMAIRIRFHPNTHETITTVENAFDVGEAFGVRIFSERSEPMSTFLYLREEEVLGRARIARNVFVLFVRENSVRARPYLRLRFNLEEMDINRRDGDGEVVDTFRAAEWIEERPVKWTGHDGSSHMTVFATWTPVGGDLLGPQYAPRVAGLQGRPLSAASPEQGNVLAFNGESWTPGDPLSGLDFAPADHTHALDDLADVSASQPASRDVLMWENGTWTSQSIPTGDGGEFDPSVLETQYVQTHPRTQTPYAIVAAGSVNLVRTNTGMSAQVSSPAYGELKVEFMNPEIGLFRLTFAGYRDPGDMELGYIVKGTPIERGPGGGTTGSRVPLGITFAVVDFSREGIIVQCVERSLGFERLEDGLLETTVASRPFMVEISRYGRG